ncbi:thiamine-phosphate synthase ThiE [Gottschalkia purinilytica]|uniref:Thiamine-phosphate synthase n=1 Tax=Gottschalkia purinilytica TaxID=1503 RepID=A0A0L0WEX9_GOTPU|nr:thiamine phosphate synthase [Gottschalkia purinilytica]KNF10043.1 thiamine-phosphate synthase ThiE [Gottschalkia purinilytica]
MRDKVKDFFNKELYCITSEEHSKGRNNIEVVKELIDAGVKIIQYREKDKKALYKYKECKEIRKLTKEADVMFIVNDNIDIAISVGADGVHIGQEDMPIEKVRELVGNDMIIGLSTHCIEEAHNAVLRGADYIGVGPIFSTNTKKDACAPVGLKYLNSVSQNISIPFVAIGGIKKHNIIEVLSNGASCVAMISEIVGANDIKEQVKNIKNIITES